MEIHDAIGRIREHGLSLSITYHPSGEESAFSAALREIADGLHEASGSGISYSRGSGEDVPGVPALTFQHEGSGPIRYMALPTGREKPPFVEMLAARIPGHMDNSAVSAASLQGLTSPVDITVFIAPACPACPNAVRAAGLLAVLSPKVSVTVVDVQMFPELAERFRVRSVPMTVIDGELLINEVIPVRNLAEKILAKGNPAYGQDVFSSLIGTGNIGLASERLLSGGQEEYFLASWKGSTLSSRIVLLMTAREALERDPDVLNGIVQALIAELDGQDDSLRGDTIDLLGAIGHPDAIGPIEGLLQSGNPDIVEIARDALNDLKSPD